MNRMKALQDAPEAGLTKLERAALDIYCSLIASDAAWSVIAGMAEQSGKSRDTIFADVAIGSAKTLLGKLAVGDGGGH